MRHIRNGNSRRSHTIVLMVIFGYMLGAAGALPAAERTSPTIRVNSLPQALSAAVPVPREQTDADPRAVELGRVLRAHLKRNREPGRAARQRGVSGGILSSSAALAKSGGSSQAQGHRNSQRKRSLLQTSTIDPAIEFATTATAKTSAPTKDRLDVLMRAAGTPRQIKARSGRVMKSKVSSDPKRDDDELTARAFLRLNRGLLGISDPDKEFTLYTKHTDELDRRRMRFKQTYRGLPVWGSEINVHLNPQGDVDLVNGAFFPTPRKLVARPVVDSQNAIKKARAAFDGGDAAMVAEQPLLMVYAADQRPARLAWQMELRASFRSRWLVIVDALNGSVLTAYDKVMDANVQGSGVDMFGETRPLNVWEEGGDFFMTDTSKRGFDASSNPPEPSTTQGGIIILDAQNRPATDDGQLPETFAHNISSNPDTGWLPDAVSAAWGLSETYDYYTERHNRTALDGVGGTVTAIVRVGQGYTNASWIPSAQLMLFGDGLPFAGALDVVAHELTHGVTTHSANLIYQEQSGALNEAFSDIFGEAVEARTFGGPDWVTGTALGTAGRSLSDPGTVEYEPGKPYPARMSEFVQLPLTDDNGGVHINSSIINHAYYLLADGLTDAIGINAAERIFYRALTSHLLPRSQFIDARLACIQSAEELFGVGSIEAQKTAEAFDAVEIFDGAGTPAPTPTTPIAGPDATLFIAFDGATEQFSLARREEGDAPDGVWLSESAVAQTRPSVARDGSFAVFINSEAKICFLSTDGSTPEDCLQEIDSDVFSVAVSPDASLFGLVFQDADGIPEADIFLIDVVTPDSDPVMIPLVAAAFDGAETNTIVNADIMEFTQDNRFLFYDALNAIQQPDGSQFGAWSIYAYDTNSGTTLSIVPPIAGLQIAFPALGQTNYNLITFDVFDHETKNSDIFAVNISSSDDPVKVATVEGDYGTPGYTGDDAAIVYSQTAPTTPTGFSLMHQPLAADRVTPEGSATMWLENADFGVIYRREGSADVPPDSGDQPPPPAPQTSSSGGGGGGSMNFFLIGALALCRLWFSIRGGSGGLTPKGFYDFSETVRHCRPQQQTQ